MAIQKTGIMVDTDPTFPNQTVFEQSGQQSMITAIGLEPDTTYHVKGYVVVDGERVYSSNTKQFTTGRIEYFSIKNTDSSTITVSLSKTGSSATPEVTVEYSLNGGAWTSQTVNYGNSLTVQVPVGESVRYRGINNAFFYSTSNYISFSSTGRCELSGDINTLINKVGGDITLPASAFRRLFYNMSNANVNGLVLPSTTMSQYCYADMFYGCTGLTTAPSLPATTLANYCYNNMFNGCTGLTTAPTLSATVLADYCYYYMFSSCTGLTTAPDLNSTSLAQYCYSYMFYGCTGLTAAPSLPATTLAARCYASMFSGCTGLTSAPALNSTSLAQYCYASMFYGCTGLTSVPLNYLPATTLANNCYQAMFQNCTSLTSAPALPARLIANYCYANMFNGCTSLTTVPSDLPAPNLASNCYASMFYGCSRITESPIIYGSNVSSISNCFNGMFRNCSSLRKITVNANSWSTSYASNWVNGVASTGDFYNLGTYTAIPIDNVSGVPIGWTNHNTYSNLRITNTDNEIIRVQFLKGSDTNITDYWFDYSTDGGTTWTTWQYAIDGNFQVILNAGEYVEFKSSYKFSPQSSTEMYSFYSSGYCTVSGNLANFGDYQGGGGWLSAGELQFNGLFDGLRKLTDASGLILGTIGLNKYCFHWLFANCSELTSPPALPATALADHCYDGMFMNCSSLASLPNLPATTMTDSCYYNMFGDCTSITNIPSNYLPATVLADNCYDFMFGRCYGLTSLPSGLLPATTMTDGCYNRMFWGCNSLTSVPSDLLPATTLAQECYREMFNACTALTSVPSDLLPATTLAEACYANMFYGCTSLTQAPNLNATTLASNCYYQMFYRCTSLTQAPNLNATTLQTNCYKQMFFGCTALTQTPTLPATTLAEECYTQMFDQCTSLNKIITYASDISATNCTYLWLRGVAASGDFYNLGGATYQSGASGIPSGWTEHTSL